MLPTIITSILASTTSTKKDNNSSYNNNNLEKIIVSLKPTSNFNLNISPQSLHKKTNIKRISVKKPAPLNVKLESSDFIPSNLHSPITNVANSKQYLFDPIDDSMASIGSVGSGDSYNNRDSCSKSINDRRTDLLFSEFNQAKSNHSAKFGGKKKKKKKTNRYDSDDNTSTGSILSLDNDDNNNSDDNASLNSLKRFNTKHSQISNFHKSIESNSTIYSPIIKKKNMNNHSTDSMHSISNDFMNHNLNIHNKLIKASSPISNRNINSPISNYNDDDDDDDEAMSELTDFDHLSKDNKNFKFRPKLPNYLDIVNHGTVLKAVFPKYNIKTNQDLLLERLEHTPHYKLLLKAFDEDVANMMAKSQDIACIAMHSVQDKELTQMYSETIVNSIINKEKLNVSSEKVQDNIKSIQSMPIRFFQDPTEECKKLFRLREIELKASNEYILQQKQIKQEEEEEEFNALNNINGKKIKKSSNFTRKSFNELCNELNILRESWDKDKEDVDRDVIKLFNANKKEKDSQENQFQNINTKKRIIIPRSLRSPIELEEYLDKVVTNFKNKLTQDNS